MAQIMVLNEVDSVNALPEVIELVREGHQGAEPSHDACSASDHRRSLIMDRAGFAAWVGRVSNVKLQLPT